MVSEPAPARPPDARFTGEELPEVGLRAVLGEELLDAVLERQVEGLGREVTNDVRQVTTPERSKALLGQDAAEAVADAGVPRHLAGHDAGVGILRLNDELHTLDGSGERLGDR